MAFELEGISPDSTLRPRSLDELAAGLSELDRAGKAAVPWGGGTRTHVGNVPAAYDAAIDLTGLPVSIEHVAGDMVCLVSANAPVSDVQAKLAMSGQRLPFDVAHAERATIGGSLASNAPGRMRSSFGGVRDWVIGLKVMLPDGTVTKSGGRVVKNVQGLDLHRLHTGAFGTLGIIVEAAFKLIPLAQSQATVAAWFETLDGAREYAMSLFNGFFLPEALTVVTGDQASDLSTEFGSEIGLEGSRCLVLAKLTGIDTAVERMAADATGLAGTLGAVGYVELEPQRATDVWEGITVGKKTGDLEVRVTTRSTVAFNLASDVEKRMNDMDGVSFAALIDVGFGGLHLSLDAPEESLQSSALTAVSDAFGSADVSFTLERLPSALKTGRDVFSAKGANMDVMKRLKNQFDPNGTLNRGRFVGGI